MQNSEETRASIRRDALKRIDEALEVFLTGFKELEDSSPDGIPRMS